MKRILSVLLVLMMVTGGAAMGEIFGADWYPQALKDSEMRIGNNVRLKKLVEKARSGEPVTIGLIGGSITEGAGAANYAECWAKRFATRFGNTYGVNNGENVAMVNGGVGGTPSTFGYMRFRRDVVDRVPETDPDGYPDLVVVEFAVNDWGEPSGHRCFESMVKEILQQPNEPAVIILFSMRDDGWNIQGELRAIGDTYDLMMVSLPDGIFPHVGNEITKEEYFFDEYHPNSNGHRMMADCLMQAVADALEKETDAADIDLAVEPAYGTDFMGLKTIYAEGETEGITVDRGGFDSTDTNSYKNIPVGWVCGRNFYHDMGNAEDPLKITGTFAKCLIAWKASAEASFGEAEVLVDGKAVMTLKGGAGKWGQSEVVLALDDAEPAEHTVEIRVTDRSKKFTVTAVAVK